MELHTLGVDGGYTQRDVIEVARALTGWTVVPPNAGGERLRERAETPLAQRAGFVLQGDFVFRPGIHDAGEKTILGRTFPAGQGIDEGEHVLDLLAQSRAAARHLSLELATRYVSDAPPKPLVDRLTNVYLQTRGDIRAMIRAIAESPEFWSENALDAKIKSPFELVVSSLRALNADVVRPQPLLQWISRMGEPLYAYQQPTGYPDRAEQWVSAGSLLNRMNFGLQLASGRIPGVRFDLAAIGRNREPESADDALNTYASLLLPGRDLSRMMSQLTPMVHQMNLAGKIEAAASKTGSTTAMSGDAGVERSADSALAQPGRAADSPDGRSAGRARRAVRVRRNAAPPSMLQQVVGVILGSPEFQRR
jgi:hypothetical protein